VTMKLLEAIVPDVTSAMNPTSVSEPATGTTTSTSVITSANGAHSGVSQDVIAKDSVVKVPNKLLS